LTSAERKSAVEFKSPTTPNPEGPRRNAISFDLTTATIMERI
jgi:hypothetical protein